MSLARRLDRLFVALPVSPIWVGLAVALLLFAISQAVDAWVLGPYEWFWGAAEDEPVWQDEGSRILLFLSLFVGAALVFDRYERAGAQRDLRELRTLLSCSEEEFEALVGDLRRAEGPGARRLTAVGAALGALASAFTAAGAKREGLLPHDFITGLVYTALAGAVVAWGIAVRLHQDRVIERALAFLPQIDLLAVERLVPFARRGLRRALGLAVGVSLLIPALFETARLAWVGPAVGVLALAWGLAAFGFVTPVLGLRRRIQAEKRAALLAVRENIRKEEQALRQGAAPGGRLADWIAYQSQIESAREWPFDVSTLVRFALYLGIPLGSWMGGALVERLVDRVLD